MPVIKNPITELGEQIRAVAKSNKINLSTMAAQLRIANQTMTNICRGRANPSMKLLKEIAAKYNKRLVILFMDKD